jgi:hypothetical protein
MLWSPQIMTTRMSPPERLVNLPMPDTRNVSSISVIVFINIGERWRPTPFERRIGLCITREQCDCLLLNNRRG